MREWRQKTTPLVNMKAIEQCPHGKEWPRPGIPVLSAGKYSQFPLNCLISRGRGRPVWSLRTTFTSNAEAMIGVKAHIRKYGRRIASFLFVRE